MFTHKLSDETEKAPVLFWRLIMEGDEPQLQASRDNSDWWYVVKIQPDGKLVRNGAIPKSLGIPIDGKGRILVNDKSND